MCNNWYKGRDLDIEWLKNDLRFVRSCLSKWRVHRLLGGVWDGLLVLQHYYASIPGLSTMYNALQSGTLAKLWGFQ